MATVITLLISFKFSSDFEFGAIGDKIKDIADWDIDVTDKVNLLNQEIKHLSDTIKVTSGLIGKSQKEIKTAV